MVYGGVGVFLTPLLTIFHLYRGSQFYCLRKPHNVVSSTPRLSRIRTHNVSGDKHQLHR